MTNVSIIMQNLAWVIMFNPFTWIIWISLHGSKCDSSKKLLQVFSLSTIMSVLTLFVLEQSLCLVILRDHYTQLVWMIISLLLLCMTFLSLISYAFSSSTFLPLWFLFMLSPPLSLLLYSVLPLPLLYPKLFLVSCCSLCLLCLKTHSSYDVANTSRRIFWLLVVTSMVLLKSRPYKKLSPLCIAFFFFFY